jgi:hypothetical protein
MGNADQSLTCHSREGGNPVPHFLARNDFFLDSRLRPPWTEVILGMQEQFPVRGNDGKEAERHASCSAVFCG